MNRHNADEQQGTQQTSRNEAHQAAGWLGTAQQALQIHCAGMAPFFVSEQCGSYPWMGFVQGAMACR